MGVFHYIGYNFSENNAAFKNTFRPLSLSLLPGILAKKSGSFADLYHFPHPVVSPNALVEPVRRR